MIFSSAATSLTFLTVTAVVFMMMCEQHYQVHAWTPVMLPPAVTPFTTSLSTTATTSTQGSVYASHTQTSNAQLQQQNIQSWLQESIGVPPAAAAEPPSKEDVQLLRQAFAAFYGTERNVQVAQDLLSQVIVRWKDQPVDEQAGLYRVRGDCYMALGQVPSAINDYSQALEYLTANTANTPDGKTKADPAELPASYLGRARAIRSLHRQASDVQISQAAQDYRQALLLSSREEWDTEQELVEDGARTNPYAAWEYGMALRANNQWKQASEIHTLAADIFEDIGDKARSVISRMDAGIDLAGKSDFSEQAMILLQNAIKETKSVEGRDIPLLQRVLSKEGEARVALASLLWSSSSEEKAQAESTLGLACQRLDQLEADALKRSAVNPVQQPAKLTVQFSIDDQPGALEMSCSRLKNTDFQRDRLEWPSTLQDYASKLFLLHKSIRYESK